MSGPNVPVVTDRSAPSIKGSWPWIGVCILLVIQAVWLKRIADAMSPTVDEPARVAAGVALMRYGDFSFYRTSGPLVHLLAALPLAGMDLDTEVLRIPYRGMPRFEFTAGKRFIQSNPEVIRELFSRARYAMIPITLLGGVLVFLLSRRLFGMASGFLSLGLWVCSPSILGHGSQVSADVAAGVATLAAVYASVRWLSSDNVLWAVPTGVAIAIGCFAKSTCVLLLPSLALLTLFAAVCNRFNETNATADGASWRSSFQFVALLSLVWVAGINSLYLFNGSFKPLGDYEFFSVALTGEPERGIIGNRFADGPLAGLPVPLPEPFVSGIDLQKSDFERPTRNYLAGQWKVGGWWYYYLYAAAVKMPHVTQLLGIGGLLSLLVLIMRRKLAVLDVAAVLLPAVCILLVASLNTALNRHYRYVIPSLAIWFVVAGATVTFRSRLLRAGVFAALMLQFAGTASHHPHYIGFFNRLAGGPEAGQHHLNHSNIDWGQDVYGLLEFVEENPGVQPLRCAYFGHCSPDLFGIETEPIEPWGKVTDGVPSQNPGWYVVSTEYLIGSDWRAPGATIDLNTHQTGPYGYFRSIKPWARIGTSLWLYHVNPHPDESSDLGVAERWSELPDHREDGARASGSKEEET